MANLELRTANLELRTANPELGTANPELGTANLERNAEHEPGTRNLERGTGSRPPLAYPTQPRRGARRPRQIFEQREQVTQIAAGVFHALGLARLRSRRRRVHLGDAHDVRWWDLRDRPTFRHTRDTPHLRRHARATLRRRRPGRTKWLASGRC